MQKDVEEVYEQFRLLIWDSTQRGSYDARMRAFNTYSDFILFIDDATPCWQR